MTLLVLPDLSGMILSITLYDASLNKDVHDIDMLDYYDYCGDYEPMASGILGTTCISDAAATMKWWFTMSNFNCQQSTNANMI